MSEHDDETPPEFGTFGFLTPSPEMQQAMQAQRDRHNMMYEEKLKRIDSLFTELSVEQMVTLNLIFFSIARSDEPESIASFYEGSAVTMLRLVHRVCPNCGEKHDDLEKLLDVPMPAPPIGSHEEESE